MLAISPLRTALGAFVFVVALLGFALETREGLSFGPTAAFAQDSDDSDDSDDSGDDDDGGGDDDDDDDDSGAGAGAGGGAGAGTGGGTGGETGNGAGASGEGGDGALLDWLTGQGELPDIFGTGTAPAPTPQPTPAEPELPQAAEREIVVVGLQQADISALGALGFELLQEESLGPLGRLARLRHPAGSDVSQALETVEGIAPASTGSPNHYFRNQADEQRCLAAMCPFYERVGWAASDLRACRPAPFVGIVDTGVNADHEALRGARLEVNRFRRESEPPSDLRHGTAVATLFVGRPESGVPGLLPDARVVVADPFVKASSVDERADVFSLAQAIEHLVARGVDTINLSLTGPDNAIIASVVQRAVSAGIPLVAAVGNAGPRSRPLYPAAYPGVIGVTAIDGRQSVYRRALQGDQVDFAAPGVNIPTAASIRGIRPQTGTSFATPFVAAAIAVRKAANPDIGVDELTEQLSAEALDLGAEGRDPVFGWGLVQSGPCPERPAPPADRPMFDDGS